MVLFIFMINIVHMNSLLTFTKNKKEILLGDDKGEYNVTRV